MSWLETIPWAEATGRLRILYERIKGPRDTIDQILLAHSLRAHTLEGHMALYKAVLHHSGNRLPKWLLETVGIYVSLLNGCGYCVEHHFAGLRRLLADEDRADALRQALEREIFRWRFRPTRDRHPAVRCPPNEVAGGSATIRFPRPARSRFGRRRNPGDQPRWSAISPTPTAPSSASACRPRAIRSASPPAMRRTRRTGTMLDETTWPLRRDELMP